MTAEPGAAVRPGLVLVGLMSGTSLDGISAAVVRFHEDELGAVAPELLNFETAAYAPAQRDRLAVALREGTPQEYARLDFELGSWFADAAVNVMAGAGVARADIAAIASHGHTVWHDPPRATWQFGQAAVIAERTGVGVVSDFRVRDVAAGGQGAPLVPIADALLFAAPSHWRALQNLGGIGNVSVVPPRDRAELASVRAFDTGPGVCIIDGVTQLLFPGRRFDEGGAIAATGTPREAAVEALLAHPYFATEPPKSTGRELFSSGYTAAFVARCRESAPGCTDADVVATAVALTARSIALAFERFIPEPVAELVLSGGGAKNPVLFAAIERALAGVAAAPGFSGRRVITFNDLYFDGEAKEAVAFAFLGWLYLRGKPGNVPSATGARGPRVLGTYTPA